MDENLQEPQRNRGSHRSGVVAEGRERQARTRRLQDPREFLRPGHLVMPTTTTTTTEDEVRPGTGSAPGGDSVETPPQSKDVTAPELRDHHPGLPRRELWLVVAPTMLPRAPLIVRAATTMEVLHPRPGQQRRRRRRRRQPCGRFEARESTPNLVLAVEEATRGC